MGRKATPRVSGDAPKPASRLPAMRPRRGCWASRPRCASVGAREAGNRIGALLPALAMLGLFACAGANVRATEPVPASAPSRALGATTHFELPSNGGALVSVPQPGARLTVVDAFAPTCVPCVKKVPALVAQRGALEAAGARLVLVAVLADGESDVDAAQALESWGAPSPFLIDRGGVLRRELAIDKLPGSVVLDASGKVRWVAAPEASADDIVAAARNAAAAP